MLRTSRCLLSEVQEADYESLKQLWTNDHVRMYLGGSLTDEGLLRSKFLDLLARSGRDAACFYVVERTDDGSFIKIAQDTPVFYKRGEEWVSGVSLKDISYVLVLPTMVN